MLKSIARLQIVLLPVVSMDECGSTEKEHQSYLGNSPRDEA